MLMARFLSEGLAYGDLKGLIKNQISIDQYKPKIGDIEDTVVIGVSVLYENPARDLSNFIETGLVETLDVDISPGPDNHGDYIVFVEFPRNRQLFRQINALLTDIDQITTKDNEWQFTVFRHGDKAFKFSEEAIAKLVINSKIEYRKLASEADQK
jgi:hypothetical protein